MLRANLNVYFCFASRQQRVMRCLIHSVTSCLARCWGYLRRDNFLPVDKLGVRHGLPVTFEHHDGLLSVAQVVVMDTVVWAGNNKCKHCVKTRSRHRFETSLLQLQGGSRRAADSRLVLKGLRWYLLEGTASTGSAGVLTFKVEENTREQTTQHWILRVVFAAVSGESLMSGYFLISPLGAPWTTEFFTGRRSP